MDLCCTRSLVVIKCMVLDRGCDEHLVLEPLSVIVCGVFLYFTEINNFHKHHQRI